MTCKKVPEGVQLQGLHKLAEHALQRPHLPHTRTRKCLSTPISDTRDITHYASRGNLIGILVIAAMVIC